MRSSLPNASALGCPAAVLPLHLPILGRAPLIRNTKGRPPGTAAAARQQRAVLARLVTPCARAGVCAAPRVLAARVPT